MCVGVPNFRVVFFLTLAPIHRQQGETKERGRPLWMVGRRFNNKKGTYIPGLSLAAAKQVHL